MKRKLTSKQWTQLADLCDRAMEEAKGQDTIKTFRRAQSVARTYAIVRGIRGIKNRESNEKKR